MSEKAKKDRAKAVSAFDRSWKVLEGMMEDKAQIAIVEEGLHEARLLYENLIELDDAYVLTEDKDLDDPDETQQRAREKDVMKELAKKMGEIRSKVAKQKDQSVKDAEKKQLQADCDKQEKEEKRKLTAEKEKNLKKSVSLRVELEMECDLFLDVMEGIQALQVDTVDPNVLKTEVEKMTNEKVRLKKILMEVVSLDPDGDKVDHKTIKDMFRNKVVEPCGKQFQSAQEFLKTAPPTPSSHPHTGSSSRRVTSDIKRETVQLPKFSGKEPEAFTSFPVWKKNWDKLIIAYPNETKAILLLDHIDKPVKDRIVGIEDDYEASIKKMSAYYGNTIKVVECCIGEISRCKPIKNDSDYKGLVNFSQILETNYKRLQSVDAEHELSNSSHTNGLVNRLPPQTRDKYMSHFMEKDAATRADPLPILMGWIEKEREKWEYQEISSQSAAKSGTAMFAGYAGDNWGSEGFKGECYRCGKTGHMKVDCKAEVGFKSSKKLSGTPKHKKSWCAFHNDPPGNHHSNACAQLRKLAVKERIQKIVENRDCPRCLGDHAKADCKSTRVCGGEKQKSGCGKNHVGHELLCEEAKVCAFAVLKMETIEDTSDATKTGIADITELTETTHKENIFVTKPEGEVQSQGGPTILQIMQVSGPKSREVVSVIWDPGATGNFIKQSYADKAGFRYRVERMSVTTLGGDTKVRESKVYWCKIRDKEGKSYEFEAIGLDILTGPMGQLVMPKLKSFFPRVLERELFDVQRKVGEVDYLIGLRNPSWHPMREVRAEGGGDLWLYRSQFGSCLGGSHPDVWETTTKNKNMFNVNKIFFTSDKVRLSSRTPDSLLNPAVCQHCAYQTKTAPLGSDMFFQLESLGTCIDLKCGGCKCTKCPIPGSRYSFQEQQQLDMIRRQLSYDKESKIWTAKLPWIKPRESLPDNYMSARKALENTEKSLKKRNGLRAVYGAQVQDMVDRGAAKKLTKVEIEGWKGVVHYIPHLVVENPASLSTPVRLVFDASRPQGFDKICLNDCVSKGPDNYLNNLSGVLLGFRAQREAAKGDIKKFYNATRLVEEDTHCQRFLWRNCEEQEPDIYVVLVNNMGIKPSGTIATCMLEETCEMFKEKFPAAANDVLKLSYVDDVGTGDVDSESLHLKTDQIDQILAAGSMRCKGWVYSHEPGESVEIGGAQEGVELEVMEEKVLGMMWVPLQDQFKYVFRLNFGQKKRKVRLEKDLTKQEFLLNPPTVLSRRQVLGQTAAIFDPLGLVTPILLQSKLLLRTSWGIENEQLGWDDPLPEKLRLAWIQFFLLMFDLEDLTFERSLTPPCEVIGLPWLILFSDGALVSYGVCCYIRWSLAGGGYWCRLIMSKGKIAPKFRATIPRMELSGAVLQVRMEKFVKEETGFQFEKVWHFVDSSTVLGYLHKNNGSFKPYEGVRVSEIQSNSKYNDQGMLQEWAWVPGGDENPADLTTKTVSPKEIGPGSMWQNGPDFLYQDESNWPIRITFSKDPLEGELKVHLVQVLVNELDSRLDKTLVNCSKFDRLLGITARALRLIIGQDSQGNPVKSLIERVCLLWEPPTAEELKDAKEYWIRKSQESIKDELEKSVVSVKKKTKGDKQFVSVSGKYKRLAPKQDATGLWRVGTRMSAHVPFTAEGIPPLLLPSGHRFTLLLMEKIHRDCGDGGTDATLVAFRQRGYWVPQGGKLAKKIRNACVSCRKLDAKCLQQPLGPIPPERLLQPVAWGHVELDLCGPFICRGEFNPRSTIKIWGIVMEDKNSGAVHADIVVGYSASAVLAALRRFGSLRGWPAIISSDPGSQLESASGKLESWWDLLKDKLGGFSGKKGFRWDISPANSPWRQGKVERRIGCLKRIIRLALGNTKVTQSELQTVLFEAASIANERPLSVSGPKEDGSYTIITPNNLLIGRSTVSLPDDTALCEDLYYKDRYHIICPMYAQVSRKQKMV